MTRAYEEIIEFIAAGTTPQSLINFQPSEMAKERVVDLILREKTEGITDEEKAELDQYLMIEHLLRLAKARAYQYITAS
jgi:hypothetical protein